MKKLQLAIEQLKVESFETDARGRSLGTVRGLETGDPCTGATYCWDCEPYSGRRDCILSETCDNTVCCAATPNTHCVE